MYNWPASAELAKTRHAHLLSVVRSLGDVYPGKTQQVTVAVQEMLRRGSVHLFARLHRYPKVKEKDTALEGYQFFMKTEAKDLLAPPSYMA